MKPINKIYNCSMQVLYMIIRLAWNFTKEHQSAFFAFSSRYTMEFINDNLAAIDNAKKISNVTARNGAATKALVVVDTNIALVCKNWRLLKRYTKKAYSKKSMLTAMLEEAGQPFYQDAARGNYDQLANLIQAGNAFISKNLDELVANNNMPADFQATFADAGKQCLELVHTYMEISTKKNVTGTTKVEANNELYKNLTDMLGDGQILFENQNSLKKLFVFKHLKSMVQKHNIAAARGVVTDATTGVAIEGVNVYIPYTKYTAVTDKDGRYDLTQLAADTYEFTFEKPNFETFTQTITIKPGVTSTINATLTKTENLLKVA